MRYRASFLAYAFWVPKNATPKNWLMQVKGLIVAHNLVVAHLNVRTSLFSIPCVKKLYYIGFIAQKFSLMYPREVLNLNF